MNKLRTRGLFVFVMVLSLLAAVHPAPAAAQPASVAAPAEGPFLIRVPVPMKPYDIALQTSERAWFTAPDVNLVGRLDIVSQEPFSTTLQTFAPPTANSRPYQIVYANGFAWFTQQDSNSIARLNVSSGVIDEFAVPTVDSHPTGIAVGPDGKIWFSENSSGKLGRVEPATGAITEFAFSNPAAGFTEIQVSRHGKVYALATALNAIVELTPATSAFRSLAINDPLGRPLGTPRSFTLDSGNGLYVTTSNLAWIGNMLIGTLEIWLWTSYVCSNADLRALSFTSSPASSFWVLDRTNSEAARIVPASRAVSEVISTQAAGSTNCVRATAAPGSVAAPEDCVSRPVNLAVDEATGNAWITDEGDFAILLWQPPYNYKRHLPVIFRNSMPQ